jgi:4-amino-4-deoxy-L-arabinose transferase-like glycosyltransferase
MSSVPPLRFVGFVLLLAVLAAAAGARAWYLTAVADPAEEEAPLHAQDVPPPARLAGSPTLLGKSDPTVLDELASNLAEHRWFGSLAPLADKEERTAHVAPGYPYLLSLAYTWLSDPLPAIRWAQLALGALTAGLYFLFARRAFFSLAVALLAGLLCALNPFWVVNTAEVNDGVLATFLLAACLFLGTRGAQEGEALTSLLFGLALAGLALVRAALLPFAVVALLWFLWHCRGLRRGWLCALLAFLGFANGVAPWAVRNFRAFNEVVPVADSMFLHLWEGNNPQATGGPQDDKTLREALPEGSRDAHVLRRAILDEPSQPRRYNLLAALVWDEVWDDPGSALRRRVWAAEYFVFGQAWFTDPEPGRVPSAADRLPWWLNEYYSQFLLAPLIGMLVLGFLGWRWTYAWRPYSTLAALAVLWVPLPYVLGHAERLWGPRLPLDGVLLCLAAFALVRLVPGVGGRLAEGPRALAPVPARR